VLSEVQIFLGEGGGGGGKPPNPLYRGSYKKNKHDRRGVPVGEAAPLRGGEGGSLPPPPPSPGKI